MKRYVLSGAVTVLSFSMAHHILSTRGKMIHTILEPDSSECRNHTNLYYPDGYKHAFLLEKFKTCSAPLSLTVLSNGEIRIEDSEGTRVGVLDPITGSIKNLRTQN